MEMIRHADPFVQFNGRTYDRRFGPFLGNNVSIFIQLYFRADDVSEQTFPILDTQRHKICPRRGIIVSLEAYRPAVVRDRTIFHDPLSTCRPAVRLLISFSPSTPASFWSFPIPFRSIFRWAGPFCTQR